MRRRSERKTTLFELIGALQRALSEEMIRKNFPKEGRHKPKLIIQIDEEGIKEKIAKTYKQVQNLAKLHEVIKFSDLISGKTKERIIGVLLSLLYLHSQRKIKIWQKKLFGEIFITLR
jgi:chromatin segregation and condensation protein Rec8/ScpA/Scc1 (kleisin family)